MRRSQLATPVELVSRPIAEPRPRYIRTSREMSGQVRVRPSGSRQLRRRRSRADAVVEGRGQTRSADRGGIFQNPPATGPGCRAGLSARSITFHSTATARDAAAGPHHDASRGLRSDSGGTVPARGPPRLYGARLRGPRSTGRRPQWESVGTSPRARVLSPSGRPSITAADRPRPAARAAAQQIQQQLPW